MHEQLQTYAWAHDTDEALRCFHTSENGLSESEADLRLRHFGANDLPRAKRFTVMGLFARQFSSPLIFILLIAMILTILLHEWIDTLVIALAIIVNAGLGFYQEFRAESTLEKLTTYIKERARVVRPPSGETRGIEQEIDSLLLVPGDIIHLSYGSRVPADARLLEVHDLSVDESVLTGESLPVQKKTDAISEAAAISERTNSVFAGTMVVDGTASALVTTTGAYTEIGRIAKMLVTAKQERTPLQRALAKLGWFIFTLIGTLVLIIFFLGMARGQPLFDMLLMAAAISVGAIPEALPIALTVILAVGVERLAKRKGIMRNLAAAETLGSTTVIMTDKTGTLTEANMRLTSIRTRDELLEVPKQGDTLTHLSPAEKTIMEAALWGADVIIDNPESSRGEWRFLGRPIETAIARAGHEHGFDLRDFSRARSSLLTFNSTNKFSISGNHAKELYVAVGAPDILLARSRLTKDDYLAIEKHIHTVSSGGKRLLGVARFPASSTTHLKSGSAKASHASDLEFLGVLVFEDALRPEAKGAIEKMEKLGVRVVMLTGDLKGTAMAVARELGWEIDEGNVLSGDELRRLSDAEISASLGTLRLFARVTPEDKLRIGKLYQARGEIVAMTGDGVNDAPSLKAMDIGIALGSGTDVAKSVAGLVLLDDNFTTIVTAIEEGRRILENIRKVFVYLTSTCLDAVILIGGSLLIGLPLPISALQIIWVNFFTDSFPALSFAFEKEYESHASQKHAGAEILTREVRILTLGIGVFTSILLFGMYWLLMRLGIDTQHARSMIFVCFSLYGLVIAYSFRSLRASLLSYRIFDNRALNLSVAFGIMLLLTTFFIPFLRELFALSLIPLPLLSIIALWLVLNILIVEAAKWGFRKFLRE